MDSLKKMANKHFEAMCASILDDFNTVMIVNDSAIDDEVKKVWSDKIDQYKNDLKESIKVDNKKTKTKVKGTRKTTNYNLFVKETMADFKEEQKDLKDGDTVVSNNNKFKNAAAMWTSMTQEEKDAWTPSEATLAAVAAEAAAAAAASEKK